MEKKRIFVTVTEFELSVIKKLMKQEKRSQAYIATMIFSDGLKLVDKDVNT